MNNYHFRLATLNDLPSLLAISQEFTLDPWPQEKFMEIFDYEVPVGLICTDDGLIMGFIVYLLILDEVRILNLTISKSHQNQGLANKLLAYTLRNLPDPTKRYVMLEVRVSNYKAIHLYTKHGFRVICTRANYYQEYVIEDGYLMQLELAAPSISNLTTTMAPAAT